MSGSSDSQYYTPKNAGFFEYIEQVPLFSMDGRYTKNEEINSESVYELNRSKKYLLPTSQLLELGIPKYDKRIIDYSGMIKIIDDFHHWAEIDVKQFRNKILNFNKFNTWISQFEIIDFQDMHSLLTSIVASMRQSLYANIDCTRSEYKILDYLPENNEFNAKIQYPTVKHKLIYNSSYNFGIPITIKLTPNDIFKETNYHSNNNYKEQIIHEAAIGVALNTIANKTPNFMYFYGLLPCDLQINTDNIKESNICHDIEYPGYAVYEYISGVSLEDVLRGRTNIELSNKDIVNVLCQVLLSLAIASKEISFTHYNLTLNNIMIVPLSKNMEVMYEYDGNVFKLRQTRYLAKIINYQTSYAYIENAGIHIANDFSGFEQYGYRAGPNHQYDIIMLMTQEYNEEIEELIMESISHLYIYDTPDVLISDIYYSFVLPKEEQDSYKYSGLSVFDYFVYTLDLKIMYYENSQIERNWIIPYDYLFDVDDDNKIKNICLTNKDKMNVMKRKILDTILNDEKSADESLIKNFSDSFKNYISEIIDNYNNNITQYTEKSLEGRNLIFDTDKLYFSEFMETYKIQNI